VVRVKSVDQMPDEPDAYFQQHVPNQTASGLCVCLRPYPCSNRTWAIAYLVRAGRLVLASEG